MMSTDIITVAVVLIIINIGHTFWEHFNVSEIRLWLSIYIHVSIESSLLPFPCSQKSKLL